MAENLQPVTNYPHDSKISDHLRAIVLFAMDKIPLGQALKIAISERMKKEEEMGPPKEPPKEAYEEEYLYQKSELEKSNKSK